MTITVEADFVGDWKRLLAEELGILGYSVLIDDPEADLKFFNIQRRRIEPACRTFHQATECSVPPEHQAGFEMVRSKTEAGDDLNPHLSKSLIDETYNDAMMNDWGIHHFHLGAEVGHDGRFMKRTGPLLFARVTEDGLYALDVCGHGSWSRQKLLEIMDKNWPELVEPYVLSGVVDVQYEATDQDIGKLRKAKINTIIKLGPQRVCAPLGGGLTGSGSSAAAMRTRNRWRKYIRGIEKWCKDNPEEIAKHVLGQVPEEDTTIQLQLLIEEDRLCVLAPKQRVVLRWPEP